MPVTIPEALDRITKSGHLAREQAAWLIRHLRAQPGADGVSTELIALPSGRTALITLHHGDGKGRIRLTPAPKPRPSEEWQRANRLYRALLGATPLSPSQREAIHRHLVGERGAESAAQLAALDLRSMAQDIRSLGVRDLLDILRPTEEVTA